MLKTSDEKTILELEYNKRVYHRAAQDNLKKCSKHAEKSNKISRDYILKL